MGKHIKPNTNSGDVCRQYETNTNCSAVSVGKVKRIRMADTSVGKLTLTFSTITSAGRMYRMRTADTLAGKWNRASSVTIPLGNVNESELRPRQRASRS